MFLQKQISFAPGIQTDSYLRARYLPNGRIDFMSIDEVTRLHANMFADMADDPDDTESDTSDGV